MQLPPTLVAHPDERGGGGGAGGGGGCGGGGGNRSQLALTLFERLTLCGVRPVLLAAQYRCPPQAGCSLGPEGRASLAREAFPSGPSNTPLV